MQLAILSQPPGSVEGRLRITEQGEMVQAKFGVPSVALRQLEVFSNSVLTATLQVGAQLGQHAPGWPREGGLLDCRTGCELGVLYVVGRTLRARGGNGRLPLCCAAYRPRALVGLLTHALHAALPADPLPRPAAGHASAAAAARQGCLLARADG